MIHSVAISAVLILICSLTVKLKKAAYSASAMKGIFDIYKLRAAQNVSDYIEQYFLVTGTNQEWYCALDENTVPKKNPDIVNERKFPTTPSTSAERKT